MAEEDEQDQGERPQGGSAADVPRAPTVHAGFALRRVPPPDGTDAPWRIAPVPTRGPIVDHERRPLFPAPDPVEQRSPAEPALERIEIIPEPPGADGAQMRGGHPTAAAAVQAPADAEPKGPNAKRVRAMREARARRIDERRTVAGRPRSGSNDRDYVRNGPTEAKHQKRGKELLDRYKWETGVAVADDDMHPVSFVNWLFSLKPTLTASSWRLYRAAAIARIQSLPHAATEEAVGALEVDVGGPDELRAPQRGRREVGDALPDCAKRISKGYFDKVLNSLATFSGSQAVPWLRHWMTAAIHTGLWPSEWAAADLETQRDPNRPQGRRAWLHVVNVKATNENCTFRTLDISDFSDQTFEAVQRMVNYAASWEFEQNFDLRQSQCTQLFYEACRALFPRQRVPYGLYTLRYQFIANMRNKYQPAEIAALVGYLTDKTAVDKHGKRRIAWADNEICEVPHPMPAEVMRMRRRLDLYEQRLEMQLARRARKERNGDD